MITQLSRDPWRAAWQILTSDGLMAILLATIAASLIVAAWLPQTPTADPIAYARWRSEAQARFGGTTSVLQALGLFTVTRSLGFRVLLAFLAACFVLRLVEGGDRLRRNREMAEPMEEWRALPGETLAHAVGHLRRRRYRVLGEPDAELRLFQADRWPWADLFPLLIYGGALLLLVGALIAQLWGWQTQGLIIQSGERVTLHGTDKWVALDDDGRAMTHGPGIVAVVEVYGPGVRVSATDDAQNGAGKPLPLIQAAEADPATQLTVPLIEDQYLAIPEAQLVLRLVPQPGQAIAAHGPVLIQAYRSPSGQLLTEAVVEQDTRLTVDGVTLELVSVPYARVTATFNPGLWPSAVGLVLLVVGILGSVVWPARRLWVRQEAEQVESTGDLPPAFARGEEM